MVLRHRGFLLDAKSFKEKVEPILAALDAGDAQPLFEEALKVVEQVEPDQWTLRLSGSNMSDIREVNFSNSLSENEPIENNLKNVSAIHSYDLGYWFFLILSTFVQRCPGIGADYSILDGVLRMLGWNQEETRLLVEGRAAAILLKPNSSPINMISHESPYWHCMRPLYAYTAGWLSREEVSDLYHHLLSEEQAIQQFDHKRFGDSFMGWALTVPEGQLDYLKRSQVAYERARMMLKTAQEAETELYMILSYE